MRYKLIFGERARVYHRLDGGCEDMCEGDSVEMLSVKKRRWMVDVECVSQCGVRCSAESYVRNRFVCQEARWIFFKVPFLWLFSRCVVQLEI